MLKVERQQKILQLLRDTGYVTVDQLSRLLYVSEPTIRRDLSELNRQHFIVRSHGGAMIRSEHNAEIPIDFRNDFQTKAKAALAKAAVALIQEGDVIFVDASTTALHILEYIKNRNDITVITNSIQAAQYLRNTGLTVYSTGGKMLDNSLAYGGSIAEEILERFNIDIMFFSAYGILEDGRIQDYSEPETSLRIKAMSIARKSAFLFDKSKLGKKSLFNVANISSVDFLVTDAEIPAIFPSPKNEIIFVK